MKLQILVCCVSLLLIPAAVRAEEAPIKLKKAILTNDVRFARVFSDDGRAATLIFDNLLVGTEIGRGALPSVVTKQFTFVLQLESKQDVIVTQHLRGFVSSCGSGIAALLVQSGGSSTLVDLKTAAEQAEVETAKVETTTHKLAVKMARELGFSEPLRQKGCQDWFQKIETRVAAGKPLQITLVLLVERLPGDDGSGALLAIDSSDFEVRPAPAHDARKIEPANEFAILYGPSCGRVTLEVFCPGDTRITINNEDTIRKGRARKFELPVPDEASGERSYTYRLIGRVQRGGNTWEYRRDVCITAKSGLLANAKPLVFEEPDRSKSISFAGLANSAFFPIALVDAKREVSPSTTTQKALPVYSVVETPELTSDIRPAKDDLPPGPTIIAKVTYDQDGSTDPEKRVGFVKDCLFHGSIPKILKIQCKGEIPNDDLSIGNPKLSFEVAVNGTRNEKNELQGKLLGSPIELKDSVKFEANGFATLQFEQDVATKQRRGELLEKIVERVKLHNNERGLYEDLKAKWLAVDMTLTFNKTHVRKLEKLLVIKFVPGPENGK